MQHETSQHEAPASGMSQTAVWTLMLLLFGPSALTLWWVIHQSSWSAKAGWHREM